MTNFAVEVKNVRSWIYPWSHEVWDLLAKLGEFSDVVPILVSRRIHITTFRMFKEAHSGSRRASSGSPSMLEESLSTRKGSEGSRASSALPMPSFCLAPPSPTAV
jgi:hypothetical protein